MHAYIFPGQGSQYAGMGKDLYEKSDEAKTLFEKANGLLGFRITDLMFEGNEEELKQTRITQPAIFLHSVVLVRLAGEKFKPDAVAGHSLGEFSALVANKTLSFADGLALVKQRANAMQEACDAVPSTMAAVIGLDDSVIEKICFEGTDVVSANCNCPGQVVISGSVAGVKVASEKLKAAGARMVVPLQVAGAFHSPFMEPAKKQLEQAIERTTFHHPICPVYQNVTAAPVTDPLVIKENLVKQLTAPVLWTQTIQRMIRDGVKEFTEAGPGNVLKGLVKKVDRTVVFSEI